jgi:hypothetical protein
MLRYALVGLLLLPLVCSVAQPPAAPPGAVAPAPPPVDRTNPTAVVQAYMRACADTDVMGAAALLLDKGGIRKGLEMLAKNIGEGPGGQRMDFGQVFREFSMMPMGLLPVPVAAPEAKADGNGMMVTVPQAVPADRSLCSSRVRTARGALTSRRASSRPRARRSLS